MVCAAGGGGAEMFGEGAGERGIAAEAAAVAGLRGPHTCVHVGSGQHQPLLGDVKVNGGARLLAEQAHHVVFADVKGLGQVGDVDVFRQIGIDVAQDLLDPAVFRHDRAGAGGFCPAHIPPNLHQQAQKTRTAEDLPAKGVAVHVPLQGCGHLEDDFALLVFQTKHMASLAGKNGGQIAVRRGFPLKILRGNVNDDPLVGGVAVQFRAVDAAAADEDDVSRLQQITLTVHAVAAAAGDKQQKLAKLVIMIIHPCALLGMQMKQPEILQQISPLFVVCHGLPP